jgi:hypothetical protein
VKGLVQGVEIALRVLLLALVAGLGVQALAAFGFGLPFGICFG